MSAVGSALQKGWRMVRLEDVAERCLGKMLDARKNKGRPFPYLRNPNVRWFEVDTSDLREMPFEEHELERYGLHEGDVVVCEGGEAGRAAIWDGRLPDVKFQKAVHRLRAGPDLFNRFLVHRLMADYDSGRLADYYTGATIKHLTGQDLARYEFRLPPVPEQRRIAELLDRAGALRSKRRAAIAHLDILVQAIFLDLFGDSASDPQPWKTKPLREVVSEFRYGTSNKSQAHGRPALRIPNVIGGIIDVSNLSLVPVNRFEFERLRLKDGDRLFVRTNGNPDYVGRCATFSSEDASKSGFAADDFIFASYLIRARFGTDEITPLFVREFMLGSEGRRQLRARSKTSAGQFNINTENLGAIEVPLPPLSLQHEFADRVAAVERLKAAHRASLTEMNALFASLQHRAFRGEL